MNLILDKKKLHWLAALSVSVCAKRGKILFSVL